MLELVWSKAAGGSKLKLKGDAIINNIVTLHNSLKAELTREITLSLDLSELLSCDLVFLQLLCALHQSLIKKNGRLVIENAPQCFFELLTEAGLGEWTLCEFTEKKNCLVCDCLQANTGKEK